MSNQVILSVFPKGYMIDGEAYCLRLTVGGVDKFQEENDSGICFEALIERETDEEAIVVAKRVAKRIGCELDLDFFTGEYIVYEKDLDCD